MTSRKHAVCLAALLSLSVAGSALAQMPRVDYITPAQGPIAGGTSVTIRGANFSGAAITINRAPLTPTVHFDSEIQFVTPPQDNGIAVIRIRNSAGTGYAEFLYVPPRLQDLPPGYITTVMGIGLFEGDGRQATTAMVSAQFFVIAADGSIYLSEPNNGLIRRIDARGVIDTYAGTGLTGTFVDGFPALQTRFAHPRGVAVDAVANVLVVDEGLHSIRRIDAQTTIISKIAGGPMAGFAGDGGPASEALLNGPLLVAFGGLGNLYILDWGNVRIRKIDSDGIIRTIAGTGMAGYSGDGGPATQATFDIGNTDAGGLAADAAGNVFLADTANFRIRRIDATTGIITTFVSDVGHVNAVATDPAGNVYVGSNDNFSVTPRPGRILKLSPDGEILQTWGTGIGFSEDGVVAASAPFGFIYDIGIDNAGNLLFYEIDSNRLRRINVSTGILDTVAGIGPRVIGQNGPALSTVLNDPGADITFLPDGQFLTAEGGNLRVRRVDLLGNTHDFAGSGLFQALPTPPLGPALESHLHPTSVAPAPNGDVFISNFNGAAVVRVDPQGNLYAVTCGGEEGCPAGGFGGDGGPASQASLSAPSQLTVDSAGNLFIADTGNNRIRRIDAQTGGITTVAGNGLAADCGDGGPATEACVSSPTGVAVDTDGTLYIGEGGIGVIRKVDPHGTISTIASIAGGGGTYLRLNAAHNLFASPFACRVQPSGHIYCQLRGLDTPSIGDGGPAIDARYGGGLISGIAVDREGNLFFSDDVNRRIRAIRFGAVISEPGSTVSSTRGTPQSVRVNTELLLPLEATVRDGLGEPAAGVRVDFSAPPAFGPSCLSGSSTAFSALTDRSGKAQARCVANGAVGSYTITATPLGSSVSASFSLTNTSAQVPTTNPLPTANFLTLIPHSAVGGGYLTRLFVTNLTASSNQLTLNRIDQNGGLVASSPVPLQPAATLLVADSESRRTQTLTIEWFAIGSELPIAASVLFDFEGQSVGLNPDIRQAVGSLAAPTLSAFTAPVRFAGTEVTIGVALANPSAASNTVNMKLIDQNGNVVGQDSLTLGPFAQTAFVLHDRPAFRDIVLAPGGFLGSLAVTTADPNLPVSALVVGGQLTEIFSLPVVSGVAR